MQVIIIVAFLFMIFNHLIITFGEFVDALVPTSGRLDRPWSVSQRSTESFSQRLVARRYCHPFNISKRNGKKEEKKKMGVC